MKYKESQEVLQLVLELMVNALSGRLLLSFRINYQQ